MYDHVDSRAYCFTLFHSPGTCWHNTARDVGLLTEQVRYHPVVPGTCSLKNKSDNHFTGHMEYYGHHVSWHYPTETFAFLLFNSPSTFTKDEQVMHDGHNASVLACVPWDEYSVDVVP